MSARLLFAHTFSRIMTLAVSYAVKTRVSGKLVTGKNCFHALLDMISASWIPFWSFKSRTAVEYRTLRPVPNTELSTATVLVASAKRHHNNDKCWNYLKIEYSWQYNIAQNFLHFHRLTMGALLCVASQMPRAARDVSFCHKLSKITMPNLPCETAQEPTDGNTFH